MVNQATKEVQQVKFKSSIQEGCEGEIEWPWTSQSPGAVSEPSGINVGPARRGEVIVGPVMDTEHPPMKGAKNCAGCHNGEGFSALRPRRLKTPSHRFIFVSVSALQKPTQDDAELPPLDDAMHRLIANAEPPQRGRVIDSLL